MTTEYDEIKLNGGVLYTDKDYNAYMREGKIVVSDYYDTIVYDEQYDMTLTDIIHWYYTGISHLFLRN